MLNITAHGNIGRDPEARYTDSSQVCNFSLAVRTGKDKTVWINCAVWGKRADVAMQYLRKGSAVTVAGRGKFRTYQKKDGSEGQVLEIDVNEFILPPRESNSEMPF